jgi:hypothetical protein
MNENDEDAVLASFLSATLGAIGIGILYANPSLYSI